jgi:threonine synthase
MCASVGKKCVIFCPASAPAAKLSQIAVYGARLFPVKGTYDDAFELSLAATKEFGWYSRNTAYNPMTVEGKKSVALEIWEDLKYTVPDKVLIPTGDGVILAGVAKGFEDLMKLGLIEKIPQLIAVQAAGSPAITKAFESGADDVTPYPGASTIADSICVQAPRNGRWALKALRESKGSCVTVTDEEILLAIVLLGSTEGIFAEPAAAATLAGLKKMVAENRVGPDEIVVALITGSGLKDVGSASKAAKIPEPIESNLESVKARVQV